MKKWISLLMVLLLCLLALCPAMAEAETQIVLSDDGITVNGKAASTDPRDAVYTANDVVFYLAGQDFTYGEGTEADAHTQEEADAHTVVHITRPGTYVLSGKLSAGQIAVEIPKAKKDEDAVVTLVLSGVDITSTVSPAVIFYNVYECSSDDEDDATMEVDLTHAGANVVIADGTINTLNGSYVARIYDPETVELNDKGTKVKDAKKLHKYDGTLYSKRSMNIYGGEKGDGILNIIAENEGLCSDLHLAIHGGNINIFSGNDGINASEDGVSVAVLNGGSVNITVTGQTGEGDGVDSNGWLIVNGGSLVSAAYGQSMDAGIDSDNGIHLNGGTLLATGNMFDHIAGGSAPYAVFSFASRQSGGTEYTLKNAAGEAVAKWTPANDFTYLVAADPAIIPGMYTLWQGDTQLAYTGSEVFGFGGGMPPMGPPPEGFEGFQMPDGFDPGQMPPEGFAPPEGFNPGQMPPFMGGSQQPEGEARTDFLITEEGGTYSGVAAAN